jgi:hypothetical protein
MKFSYFMRRRNKEYLQELYNKQNQLLHNRELPGSAHGRLPETRLPGHITVVNLALTDEQTKKKLRETRLLAL